MMICDGGVRHGPRLLRRDAQLQPQRCGSDRDGPAGHRRRLGRGAEHVDQTDRSGDVVEAAVGRLAEYVATSRVDRNDAPSVVVHVRRDVVSGLGLHVAGAHHRDGVVGRQDLLHDLVGAVRHQLTVPGRLAPV